MEVSDENIKKHTISWIKKVVIGLNFCPFAAKVMADKQIYYQVVSSSELSNCMLALQSELDRLDSDEQTETSFLILPKGYLNYSTYLDAVIAVEHYIEEKGYGGTYQIASFHPDYCFEGSDENDAANFTNRSPYPMLHLLREASISKVVKNFKNPESIPENNIQLTREKGLLYMQLLKASCME